MVINVKLSTAVEQYMESDGVRALAPTTRTSHRRVLARLKAISGSQLNASELRVRHFEETLRDIREGGDEHENGWRRRAGWSARSGSKGRGLNNDRAVLRRFVTFLHREDYLSPAQNPAAHLENEKRKRTFLLDDKILTRDQARLVLGHANDRHPRDRIVVMLGLHACFRESEVRELRVGGVNFETKRIKVWRDKQDEWHEIGMAAPLEAALHEWFAWVEAQHGPLEPEWYVVPARVGPAKDQRSSGMTGLNRRTPVVPWKKAWNVRVDFQIALTKAGLRIHGNGLHMLRRTGACWLLDEYEDIRIVMHHLGHKDQETTEIYLQHNPQRDKVQAAVVSFDPLGVAQEPIPPAGDNVIQLADRRRGVA